MYVYTTTTKIVFLVVIEHFLLFCRLSFLYDFKGVFNMVEKKTDRRILKTKRALRESLLYLLKEQPIQKISVSRLCEKSDINRSTFYTYYSSPMDSDSINKTSSPSVPNCKDFSRKKRVRKF